MLPSTSTTTIPGPPKLINKYNLRQVATAKPCSICSKETVYCLSNDDVSDFLYTCASHLADRGFAIPTSTPPPSSPGTPPVPQSEIDKVKLEYEERMKRKKDKEATAAGDKEPKEVKSWLSTATSGISTLASSTSSLFTSPPSPSSASTASVAAALPGTPNGPKVFVLNRGIFNMRVDQNRKRWQAKEARTRLEGLSLPSVPRGGLAPVGIKK